RRSSDLFLPPRRGTEQSARILKLLASLLPGPEGLGLRKLLSRRENPLLRGTKYFIIGPPPLTEDSNLLFEQNRRGREMEYFMILPQGSSPENRNIPGLPTHKIEEYGKRLIHES
ncbi:MAG: hypothetical protein PQJ60_12705, partial [Spirochaetales bacterium]|nr:hypothetical protein [Spirochaetales bacterium]